MTLEGPKLEALLNHLANCPPEFVQTCQTQVAARQIAAILCDHFRSMMLLDSTPFVLGLLGQNLVDTKAVRYYSLLAVAIWLLNDEWFTARTELLKSAWKWLQGESFQELSAIVPSEYFVTDPDRREELVRLCLEALNLRPLGETVAQASDRRTTLDSLNRQKVLAATAAAEKRAREVREAMAQARALEAANRYGE